MFGPRYFGPRYFGPRYWGNGGVISAPVFVLGIVTQGLVGSPLVWGILTDSQTPGWTPITDSQTPGWSDIDDDSSVIWTKIPT
jgi:hypothetical protein